jgi:dihydroxyacetone kinase
VLEGIQAVSSLGGAKLGDRTLLDALIPAQEALQRSASSNESSLKSLQSAVEAAQKVITVH